MGITKKTFLSLVRFIECVLMFLGVNAIVEAILPKLHVDFFQASWIAVFVSFVLVFVLPALNKCKL